MNRRLEYRRGPPRARATAAPELLRATAEETRRAQVDVAGAGGGSSTAASGAVAATRHLSTTYTVRRGAKRPGWRRRQSTAMSYSMRCGAPRADVLPPIDAAVAPLIYFAAFADPRAIGARYQTRERSEGP